MTPFGQSALLQALGWATLNSFWQVGLLWCCFALFRRYFSLSTGHQYRFAVGALSIGLISFFLSLWFYLVSGADRSFALLLLRDEYQSWLPLLLSAASVSYLILLFIPATRLIQNWRFLRRLRTEGLHKAPVQYRVFVQKISGHLGLHKPVRVHLSALVTSPVTIGFLKPLILLPVASFNQLTLRQAEAILLHELAHIRRFDYLVNIGITLTHTLLYFNPFVRLFVRAAEASREECCDSLVLQFDYDRVAYASALLQLEKNASPYTYLAIAATGKNQLLTRIQAILGQNRLRHSLRMQHFTGMLASLLCVFTLHSLLISSQNNAGADPVFALSRLANPFTFYEAGQALNPETETAPRKAAAFRLEDLTATSPTLLLPPAGETDLFYGLPQTPEVQVIQVANYTTPEVNLQARERQQVTEVVKTTREVLAKLEWLQLEKQIGDGLTEDEKAQVYQQYQEEVKSLNWEKMEENLVQNFHVTNWEKVHQYLGAATVQIKADSLANAYNSILAQLETMRSEPRDLPLPDVTTGEIETLKVELRKLRDSLYITKERPVIRL